MLSMRKEIAAQLRLAVPVVAVNLSLMSMNIVDSAMMGHVSTAGFAAVRQGHAVFWVPLSFGLGVLMALDPLMSQAVGARDTGAISRSLQRGLVLALLLSLPVGLLMLTAGDLLHWLGQPPSIIAVAADYAQTCAWALPGLLLFAALRRSLESMGRVAPLVVVAVVANLVNGLLDWVLIRGELGFPKMGAHGCALATVACSYVMFGLLIVLTRKDLLPHILPWQPRTFSIGPLLRMLWLGVPIGLTVALEIGAFNAVTFVMGWFGEVEIAANGIVLSLASVSFMVPLGLGTAAAVRVGRAVGAGDPERMRQAARVALVCGALVMCGFAILFVSLPGLLLSAFSKDPRVLALALTFMPLAAAFQLFDGLQVVGGGVLRGVGDVRFPMLANFVGYWILALPLGVLWARRWDGGPQALWCALGVALAFVAIVLVLRVRNQLAGDVQRLDLEIVPEASAGEAKSM
jgi:MATE family multidrug resistance protein